MKNLAHFAHFLKSFSGIFNKPTYSTFKNIVESMVKFSDYSQADLASVSGKTLRQVQYFFSKAEWCYKGLNDCRLRWLRNRNEFRNRTTDDVILDGSVTKKDKDSKFKGLTSFMYSNLSKGVVNGFMVLGASIRTKEHYCYLLNVRIFLKNEWKSEWEAWMKFANHIAGITKGKLWILDRGFRNQYFLSHILKLQRLFLVRVSLSLNVLLPAEGCKSGHVAEKKRGRKKQFPYRRIISVKKWTAAHKAILCNNGRLWFIPHAVINAWMSEIKQECSVIVFHRNGFRNPLVLVYSQVEMNTEMALEMVGKYIGRWSIETLFKETKSWFCFGEFQVTSLTAIYRFMHMVIFTHSLLTILAKVIHKYADLIKIISFVLKKSRNISECVVIGLKLFYESVSAICFRPPKWLRLKEKRLLIANFL